MITGNYYRFKVVAINVIGKSEFSDPGLIIAATLAGQPGVPVEFSASVDEIEIRWEVPLLGNGGTNITDYKVEWDKGAQNDVYEHLDYTGGYLTYTVTQVKSADFIGGLWYTFRVSAINAIGEGVYSESIAILAAEVPTAPLTPTLVSQTETQIVIRWIAPHDGGSPIRDYEILMDSVGVGNYAALVPTVGNPSTV